MPLVDRLKAELDSMPKKMVCHKECARLMVNSLEEIVVKQTHVLTISTYTFSFDSNSMNGTKFKPHSNRSSVHRGKGKRTLICAICSKTFKCRKTLKVHTKLHACGSSQT